jgi:hypothetical protein
MRCVTLLAAIALAACITSDDPVVTAPQFSHDADLVGTPDLSVDQKTLATSWVVYQEFLAATSCDVIEGGVQPGDHKTLRFTVNTPNTGDADLFLGDPNVHFDPNGDGNPSDGDGLFELATCHNHYHFRHYATYELIPILPDGSEGAPVESAKRGFCMIDVAPFNTPGLQPKAWVYRSCGRIGIPGNQGIATGWADQYYKWLQGQYFVIDGLPAGPYLIRIHVNPPFVAAPGESCPHTDPAGFCHQLPESDYGNNVSEVLITIPDRTGKTGYGPGGGNTPPANANAIDDEKRPTGT